MPYMVRLEVPGALYHVMARGIDGQAIYSDMNDNISFLDRLGNSLAKAGYKCLAWCLMDNHYHLLLRSSEIPLRKLMRPLNGWYARRFNRKYRRKGYLFQDRFKSVLCQDLEYARQLIRYIHLNPLRAGLIMTLNGLAEYPWCGHAFLLGKTGVYGENFQERNETLRRFGSEPRTAVSSYLDFLADGIDESRLADAGHMELPEEFEITGSEKGWPAVIGDHEFARKAMERHRNAVYRRHRQSDYQSVLQKIATEVCIRYSLTQDDLFRRGRNNNRTNARSLFCYRAHVEELIPESTIARYLRISISPVSLMIPKGKEITQA